MNTMMRVIENLDFIRARCRNLMGKGMLGFGEELKNSPKPDPISLPKRTYIKQWLVLFAEDLENDECNLPHIIERFISFNVLQLETAFNWTLDHFAELDLGGNMKWCATSEIILEQIQKGYWDNETERFLIADYITETRWYDF